MCWLLLHGFHNLVLEVLGRPLRRSSQQGGVLQEGQEPKDGNGDVISQGSTRIEPLVPTRWPTCLSQQVILRGRFAHFSFFFVFFKGPENPWLVQAYVHAAKHPFASVVGQEVFQSGIIPSDTDFRIYRDFGNIPGNNTSSRVSTKNTGIPF